MKDVVLIGGSDPSGGAGIQADIETLTFFGVKTAHVITAITVQDDNKLSEYFVIPCTILANTLDLVFSKKNPTFVKIGMLGDESVVTVLTDILKQYPDVNVILDPVHFSSSGYKLITDKGWDLVKTLLLPQVFLITPNLSEAMELSGISIETETDVKKACEIIHEKGARNVIITGGHSSGDPVDMLYMNGTMYPFKSERVKSNMTRGTGCRFSSAVTALLADGALLEEAIPKAKRFISEYIKKNKIYFDIKE